ncbi:hypothetical protein D9619_013169 [Psilocybe cf. subviscida]|uniref:WSC domain-containing protein n=1 Tax=Psilocybe cf. subviscida TaxID=2480587 RepID=A0A8H5B6Q1_9AGAR|nr:hypothetical protein D9619_013169 [Psilocybe cf. subviscida]
MHLNPATQLMDRSRSQNPIHPFGNHAGRLISGMTQYNPYLLAGLAGVNASREFFLPSQAKYWLDVRLLNTTIFTFAFSDLCSDCTFTDEPIDREFLFGPAFSDWTHMTIEACVSFCDTQGSRLAGLKGGQCRCANIFNPSSCFESDFGECEIPAIVGLGCPGNRRESCGTANGTPPLFNIFFKQSLTQFACSDPLWPGGAPLTAIGSWRFSYFYNDSSTTHALSHNAAELPSPPPTSSLTTVACVTTCNNAGANPLNRQFIAQVWFYKVCGNSIVNGAIPVKDCPKVQPFGAGSSLAPCSGNNLEFCGGTDIVSIYTLSGTGLVPMISFDSGLDDFCSSADCVGHT